MTSQTAVTFAYVGTLTRMPPHARGHAEGIAVLRRDAPGALVAVAVQPGVDSPSFLTLHPTRPLLYSVNAVPEHDGRPGGSVSAFAIDPVTGRLTFLNRQPSYGAGPAHIAVDRGGRWVFVANYGGGSVAMLPIGGDGRVGPATSVIQHEGSSANPERQAGPHAHSITLTPDDRYALVCDLGIDRVLVYRIDHTAGQLVPNDPPGVAAHPGAGPRHLDLHPNGRTVYVINELGSTIAVYDFDAARGILTERQVVSTLPEDFSGTNSTADIHVSPDGHFVYGSNRGHDSLASFAVDAATGDLTPRGHVSTGGRTPRHFVFDPTGTIVYALNQDTDTIVSFAYDPASGALTPTGQVLATLSPVCLRFRGMSDE